MEQIKDILADKRWQQPGDAAVNGNYTVNSSEESLSTVNGEETVDGESEKTVSKEIEEVLRKHNMEAEDVAMYLAGLLNDTASTDYYAILVNNNNPAKLLELGHYVRDLRNQGKIRVKPAIYFQAILKKMGIRTKFKRTDSGELDLRKGNG